MYSTEHPTNVTPCEVGRNESAIRLNPRQKFVNGTKAWNTGYRLTFIIRQVAGRITGTTSTNSVGFRVFTHSPEINSNKVS